eukprot:CAMPEP_0178389414 /NCGR_PEP_ID=MMETSP0689_2-20121128/10104_1 /TAXON_ID=160604 /ORGANISM="Amphidinium massartii, Strain CS-259" /LENGTH=511 /DNA_ID=CAMNT_0020009863 /DNA_START=162 /DNA_END=1697 /DNA_ORIENTATION=-
MTPAGVPGPALQKATANNFADTLDASVFAGRSAEEATTFYGKPVVALTAAAALIGAGAASRRQGRPTVRSAAGGLRTWLQRNRSGPSPTSRRQAPVEAGEPYTKVLSPSDLGWTDEMLAETPGLREELELALSRGGMQGKALKVDKKWPSKSEVMNAIPRECFKRNTLKSVLYTISSLVQVGGLGYLAWKFLPLTWSALPLWLAYAVVQGTFATGLWVIAHECGHNAYSDRKWLQTFVGYVLHTFLMVPYFSWQRSHAVHHSRTNHTTEGETHVPRVHTGEGPTSRWEKFAMIVGNRSLAGAIRMIMNPLMGWPAYLTTGASGGPKYGITNHMWPYAPFNNGEKDLFPGQYKAKVLQSDLGLIAMVGLLGYWASQAGIASVLALYAAPLMITNAWLVIYTWLQHTDVDVPHWDDDSWNWARGAFHTIDRPYGRIIDFIHHRIGSTHVAHHVNSAIPHYNAVKATEALKKKFPDIYLYDPTPLHRALYRVAKNCFGVRKTAGDGMLVYKQTA